MQSSSAGSGDSTAGLSVSILWEYLSSSPDKDDINITLLDDSMGLFGEFINANQVLRLLKDASSQNESSNNVGTPVVSSSKLSSQSLGLTTFWDLNKDETVTPHEIPLEIHNSNTNNGNVRVRWIDENGSFYPWLHQWDVPPSSSILQYTKPGHLFLFTWIRTDGECHDEEVVLAAYRTKRALPSLSAHTLFVCDFLQEDAQCSSTGVAASGAFCLGVELLLLDETKLDALSIAACDLDRRHETAPDRQRMQKVVSFLQKIIGNLMKDPLEPKFQSLRLGNPKIQSLVQEWGALQFLKIVGFEEELIVFNGSSESATRDYCLVLKSLPVNQALCKRSLAVLATIAARLDPSFIADLAPPTPWQEVSFVATSRTSWGSGNRIGFITDEERWARAERVANQRRTGIARRPNPGEAPSSRGKWGR